ncbi:hypothetical protein Q7C36_020035 [Tachysurus vachellii]|uniref:Uncharacterized protein n=1 Tax=Tachysurus vachellii TaxID=175792 RepID=A0AA88LSX9_TACVA|nr:hypothetical protein Q7C36_020035 [Tachysurus vachellii]
MYSEVKTDAIRKYDDTKMDEDGYPQTDYSVAVEWQKGKKPKHGWPVYAASIKFIKEFLWLDSNEMDRPLPKKRATVPPTTDSDETDDENTLTQKKKTVIPKPQRNVAQMVIDEYQVTTLTETQKRLKEMEEENQKLRNDNEKLRTMLFRGMYYNYFTELPNLITEVKMALKSQCPSMSSASSDLEGGKGFPLSVTEPSPPKAVSTEQVVYYLF